MALARHRPGEGLARFPAAYDEDVVILGRRQLLGSWESWRRRSLATVMASKCDTTRREFGSRSRLGSQRGEQGEPLEPTTTVFERLSTWDKKDGSPGRKAAR